MLMWGLYSGSAATDIILDSLTVNEFDGDGINISKRQYQFSTHQFYLHQQL